MNNMLKKASLILLLAVVPAVASTRLVRQESGQGGPAPASPVFRLATTTHRLVRLEPIPLLLSLKNEGPTNVEVATVPNLRGPYLELYVVGAGGQMVRMEGLTAESVRIGPARIKLKPEEKYEEKILLTLGVNKYFQEAGTYHVQAVLYDDATGGKLTSNVLEITVAEPEGVDSQAFDYLMAHVNPSTFFENGARKSLDRAEEFVQFFPASRYGDYVVYQLGLYYLERKQFDKSVKHFEKLLGKSDFVFSERVKSYFALSEKMKDKKKDKDEQ